MAKPYRDSSRNRRRWILALLVAVLVATVSTLGPSHALSGGLTNASVAVMETFSAMLGSEAPSRTTPAASTPSSSKWIDDALTPEYGQLGAGAIESAGGGESFSVDPAISNAALAITSQQFQLSGAGWGGGGAGGGGLHPGFSQRGAGGGGGGGGGVGGSAGQLLSEFAGLDHVSSTRGYSFESGIALTNNESVSFEPPALHSTPSQPSGGSGGGSGAGSGSGSPVSETSGLGSPFSAPPGAASGGLGGSTADGAVPGLILAGLFNDVGVPNPALAPGDSLAADPSAAGGGFDLTQVPEPSTVILISLGVAATARRRFQDLISRYL